MEFFWAEGPLFVKELLAKYSDPKPHFNTLSTMVRILESNGFLDHIAYGNTYQYFPLVSKEAYGKSAISGMISHFFAGSYLDAVSAFVKEDKISVEELNTLVEQIKNDTRQ